MDISVSNKSDKSDTYASSTAATVLLSNNNDAAKTEMQSFKLLIIVET